MFDLDTESYNEISAEIDTVARGELSAETREDAQKTQQGGTVASVLWQKRWLVAVVIAFVVAIICATTYYSSHAAAPTQTPMSQEDDALHLPHVDAAPVFDDIEVPVETIRLPNMENAYENEELIFGKFRNLKPDKNGWYSHAVHVVGANGRYMKVRYRGRYQQRTFFHNLELDDKLEKFGCTPKAMVLQYDTEATAQTVVDRISNALSSSLYDKAILSGRQIRRCPKSKEPEELLRANQYNLKPEQSRMTQSVRMITGVHLVKNDGVKTHVHVDTSYATLTDVFQDLEFSGETDMIERNQHQITLVNNENGIPHADLNAFNQSEYPTVPINRAAADMDADSDNETPFAEETLRRRLFFKRLRRWFRRRIVKPTVNFVKKAFGGVKKFVKAVATNVIQPVVKFVAKKLAPVLFNKKNTHNWPRILTINYNSKLRRASRLWKITVQGLDIAPIAIGRREPLPSSSTNDGVAKNPPPTPNNGANNGNTGNANNNNGAANPNEKGQRSDTRAINIAIAGAVSCSNCFLRVYDGKITWHIKIGGSTLAYLEIIASVFSEVMIEIEAEITIGTQVTQSVPGIPIPYLSIPLGVVTLGFELGAEIGIGMEIEVKGLYYMFHQTSYQKGGLRGSLTGGLRKIRDGWTKKNEVGPVIREGVTLSLYVLPLVSITFTNAASLEIGVQPTLKFALEPAKSNCRVRWMIEYSYPIVVGGWIGIMTKFGNWQLAGFTQSFTLLSVPIAHGCIAPGVLNFIDKYSPVRFANSQPAVTQASAPGRAAVLKTDADQWTQGANRLERAFKPKKVFGQPNEKWVLSNHAGVTCRTTCRNTAGAWYAVESGLWKNRYAMYVCYVPNLYSQGNRPGYNLNLAGEGGQCTTTIGNAVQKYGYFNCLCREGGTNMMWKPAVPKADCGTTCRTGKGYAIAAGPYKNSGIFYVCRANVANEGYRPGFLTGPFNKNSRQSYMCTSAYGTGSSVKGNYDCLCVKPKSPCPTPLKWFKGQSNLGCPLTCHYNGYFSVVSSGKGAAAKNPISICAFDVNKIGMRTGYQLNLNGAPSRCASSVGQWTSRSASYDCLCGIEQAQFLQWVYSSRGTCSAICAAKSLKAVKSGTNPGGKPYWVCRVQYPSLKGQGWKGDYLGGWNREGNTNCGSAWNGKNKYSKVFECGCSHFEVKPRLITTNVPAVPQVKAHVIITIP